MTGFSYNGAMELRIKVETGVRREGVEEARDGRLIVRVRAPRKEGKANERMKEVLAAHFGVPPERVIIVRGATSTAKTVRIMKEKGV